MTACARALSALFCYEPVAFYVLLSRAMVQQMLDSSAKKCYTAL